MKQPHVYTLPERFIKDEAVPFRWKLYTIINGFWIAGKPVFASNAFFAEKLGCSERTIREGLLELEKMYLITRHGSSQKRRIIPGGHGEVPESERVGTLGATQGGTPGAIGVAERVPHISDSISDSEIADEASAPTIDVPIGQDTNERTKVEKRTKDKEAIYLLFSSKEQPWWRHAQQKKAALSLFDLIGVERVKSGLEIMKEHQDDKFCPQASTPFQYEEKLPLLARYVKKHGL